MRDFFWVPAGLSVTSPHLLAAFLSPAVASASSWQKKQALRLRAFHFYPWYEPRSKTHGPLHQRTYLKPDYELSEGTNAQDQTAPYLQT